MYYGNSDIEDMMELLSSTAVLTFVTIFFIIFFVLLAGLYVLNSIGLYRMAKKMGHDKPWLAWIPIANMWLMFTLPDSEYRVLALNKVIEERSNAFWIYMAIQYGSTIVVTILSALPIIGYLTILISPLVSILTLLTYIFMMYPVYKDLFEMFLPEASAKNYAIASIICAYFVPIVPPILILIVSGKEPIITEGPVYNQQYYTY